MILGHAIHKPTGKRVEVLDYRQLHGTCHAIEYLVRFPSGIEVWWARDKFVKP